MTVIFQWHLTGWRSSQCVLCVGWCRQWIRLWCTSVWWQQHYMNHIYVPRPPVFDHLQYILQAIWRQGRPPFCAILSRNFLFLEEHFVFKLYLVRLPCLVLGVGSIHKLWLCSGEENQWVSLCTGPEACEEHKIPYWGNSGSFPTHFLTCTHYKLPPNPCVETSVTLNLWRKLLDASLPKAICLQLWKRYPKQANTFGGTPSWYHLRRWWRWPPQIRQYREGSPGDGLSLQIPPPQSSWLDGNGGASWPECPGRVHEVMVVGSLQIKLQPFQPHPLVIVVQSPITHVSFQLTRTVLFTLLNENTGRGVKYFLDCGEKSWLISQSPWHTKIHPYQRIILDINHHLHIRKTVNNLQNEMLHPLTPAKHTNATG